MVAKVTSEGLLIPPALLVGIEAVEIRKEGDRITLIPTPQPDPILNLGRNPVPCGVTDASESHDQYLSGTAS
jgi:virulence-associated protein VagC